MHVARRCRQRKSPRGRTRDDYGKTDQRRGSRFPVIVPVQAKWQEASGRIVVESAQAREVNSQGGLLDMKIFPSVGSQMELTNLLSGETYRARVGAIRRKDGRVL